ncbi:MAG: hypothetical protein P8R42_03365 [Candidatus Binatia bacterium]|nr:hypothetical protein [Candidatus Binatia bacterium]
MRNTTKSITGLAVLLVVGAALHFFGGNIADPDLWAHLQYGRAIFQGEGLPTVEVYSYTAAGAPFYDHEWLTDYLTAGVFDTFGATGLVVGKLLVLAAMLVLLIDTARVLGGLLGPGRNVHPLTAAAVLVLGLAVIGPGATFRAQLFTMTFLALEGWLLTRAEVRARQEANAARVTWEILVLPPLLLLWANLHGGFLVGLGMFGLYAVSVGIQEIIALRTGRSVGEAVRRIGPFAVVCVAAVLAPIANPYGIELYTYLARTLDMHGQISEWYPVALFSGHFLRFKIMVLLSALGIAVVWPGWSEPRAPGAAWPAFAWRVAFYAFAAYMAFKHQRHTVLFGIVATPFLVVSMEQVRLLAVRRFPALRPRRPVFAVLAAGAASVALFQVVGFARQIDEHGGAIRYGRLDYPVDALGFLTEHGFDGNLAMPFEWGAYAITKMAPESRVFIDGRFEAVYPKQVIDDYFAFMNGTAGWERLLDEYPTDIVVVQRWRNIHPRLFARDDLHYVYSDPASLVFVRPGVRTDEALRRLASVEDRNDFPRLATYFP